MKLILDTEACTGHGRCYSLAASLFDSDEQGHSVLLRSTVDEGSFAEARAAVVNCPEGAISLVDD